MKRYLIYITALIASFTVASCLDDPYLDGCPEETSVPVQLTISFAGNEPMSRDVSSSNETLDYTTEPQSRMDDVYVLVFDSSTDKLLYLVEDLSVGKAIGSYYTRVLSGVMQSTTGDNKVKLAVLANLDDQNIDIAGYDNMQAFLESQINETSSNIYQKLIYSYSQWDISSRAIPMWGVTTETTVPSNGVELDCSLYRAVAKVQVWVNNKQGIPNFVINSISVNNVNDKGYCVSIDETNNQVNVPSPDVDKQYQVTSVPATAAKNISFKNMDLNVTTAYSDMIYLPEQVSEENEIDPLSLTIRYSEDGGSNYQTKTVTFYEVGYTEVIRNHSYIFNIVKNSDTNLEIIITINEYNNRNETYPNPFSTN